MKTKKISKNSFGKKNSLNRKIKKPGHCLIDKEKSIGSLKAKAQKFKNRRHKEYEDSLLASLRDPVEAATYLSVHLEDNSRYAEEAFLLALQDVAKAYGMSAVSKKAKVGRESLYKTLSGSVNPKLKTLKSILDSVGLKMTVEPKSAS